MVHLLGRTASAQRELSMPPRVSERLLVGRPIKSSLALLLLMLLMTPSMSPLVANGCQERCGCDLARHVPQDEGIAGVGMSAPTPLGAAGGNDPDVVN